MVSGGFYGEGTAGAMDARRARRSMFRRGHTHSLLPLRARRLSNTISCWYCDLKVSALNEPVFRFGRTHARLLRVWFSMGSGFTLTSLIVVTMILSWELARALHLCNGNTELSNVFNNLLFGFSPPDSGLTASFADVGYLSFSSLIAVSVHEFGHALAAASEGVQMEYIAIFVAVLFPGALVAFNYELLEMLPRTAAFRIYSAGIWHNAMCCAACILALFLLPFILSPFYIHSENPMVLDVTSTSPLSGYLSTGDIIVSLDGMPIHDVREWVEMTANIHQQTLKESNYSKDFKDVIAVNRRKGYCVPRFMIEESKKTQLIDNQTACPNDLTAFITLSCPGSSILDDSNTKPSNQRNIEIGHCLAATDIVKLKKCGDGWVTTVIDRSSCVCLEDEYCSTPVLPGLTWVEITYSRPYSSECLQRERFPGNFESGDKCGGAIVFVGDLISMANSVQLSAYQPRWAFSLGAYFPQVLEKVFISTCHVSLTLALFNSLPIYFLDGETILEVALGYFHLRSRTREKVLQACLFMGTLASMIAFWRMFLNFL